MIKITEWLAKKMQGEVTVIQIPKERIDDDNIIELEFSDLNDAIKFKLFYE